MIAPSRGVRAALALGLALGLALAALLLRRPAEPPPPLVGERVAPVELPRLLVTPTADPPRQRIGDAGAAALVHFWAPSCPPCVVEAPRIDALARRAASVGVALWTVTADPAQDVRRFLAQHELAFAVLHDTAGAAHRSFGVATLPATFALDRRGVVVRALYGAQQQEALDEALAALQNE